MLGIGDDQSQGVGRIFDLVAFETAAEEVEQLYYNEGYLFAQVEPYWERATGPGGRAVHGQRRLAHPSRNTRRTSTGSSSPATISPSIA